MKSEADLRINVRRQCWSQEMLGYMASIKYSIGAVEWMATGSYSGRGFDLMKKQKIEWLRLFKTNDQTLFYFRMDY